jgi:hypothetical protein
MAFPRILRPALLAFCGLAPLALPASAAPVTAPAQKVQTESLAQPVACWWRNGVRHCNGYAARGYGYRSYGYGPSYGYRPSYGHGYGAPRPEELRFGSTEWWRAMDREGRGGYRR